MFSVFMVDCTLWYSSSSVYCSGFDLFPSPSTWKNVWLCCCKSTSVLCLSLLNKTFLPDLRPTTSVQVLICLCGKPYFWSANFQLVIVIAYDALTVCGNVEGHFITSLGLLAVFSKLFTLLLMYQLNFTRPPKKIAGFAMAARLAYTVTVVAFTADNLILFLGETTQVAYKIYSIRSSRNMSTDQAANISLMLRVVNASLYYEFWYFFWCKLFHGNKDILTTYQANLADVVEQAMALP